MATPPGRSTQPEAARALAQYASRAAHYDLELAAFEPLRAEAIRLLALAPGQQVIDVGCGTGLSFGPLRDALGPGGRILAFDPCPEMLALARERIATQRWSGITLQQADAGHVRLQGRADAALFHFTHDVLRDPQALQHVLAHLKPGARVVATGLQWAPGWMVATNAFVFGAALYSVSNLSGLGQPWDLLAACLADVEVRTRGWGGIYLLSGRVPAPA